MKDHIHTIPVLDALRDPGNCPFCTMYRQLDKNAVDFIMGPAYMDEDIRDKTNEAGFCEDHLHKLYAVQNRLGAALLLHTHIQQIVKDFNNYVPGKKTGFFKQNESASDKLSKQITERQKRCFLCEKIDDTFKRYIDTFFYMWPREKEIVPLVEVLPGFCLPHFAELLTAAEKSLSGKQLEGFLAVVIPLQKRALSKIEGDMDWFIQKFDYRNAKAPWKDSQDAIPRAMALLKGLLIE